jgi:hypothetical protein
LPEINFYNKKSGVKSIKLMEIEGRKLMLVQFGFEKNFRNDLTWAPSYQELSFIFSHLDLAEKFNFEEKTDLSEINMMTLFRIQWQQWVQRPGCISKLPKGFYPSSRKYLTNLLEGSRNSPEIKDEYDKANHIIDGIIKGRLRKIFLSVMGETGENINEKLSDEERELFSRLKMLYDSFLSNGLS